jgi:hypothetical protein
MPAKLEKYLKAQRENLDVESPDENMIWAGIQNDLRKNKIKQLSNRLRLLKIRNIAATAIIIFSLGYMANDIISGRRSNVNITLSSIDNELGRREKEYKTLVTYKTEEVRSFAGSNDKIINQLFTEISDLDIVYNQAMKDLKELGPNEKIINTIFSTYEQKIRLLELIILESNKTHSHENNEKVIL